MNEAMLSKKPLGGWSCASCEKSIFNMSSNMAEFQVNNKLPQEKPVKVLSKLVQNVGMDNLRYKRGNYHGIFDSNSPQRNEDNE